MNVVEMHQWFDQIQDKVDTIYFLESEKDSFINRAIQLFINDIIHEFGKNREGQLVISSTLEQSLNVSEVLRPLMLLDLAVTTDADGLIPDADIDIAIEAASGEEESFLHILAIADDNGIPVTYVRENDFNKFQQNDFKQATAAYPQFRVGFEGVYISPKAVADYSLSLIKSPKQVNYDTLSSTDLPETTHDYIMAKALELAGLASESEALVQIRNAV